jgi:cell division septum initiation protein DivIVA
MPKVTVDVPMKDVDESLRAELRRLQRSNTQLHAQVKQLKAELSEKTTILDQLKDVVDAVRNAHYVWDDGNERC